MRISDWSSDVCSSDLKTVGTGRGRQAGMSEPSQAAGSDGAESGPLGRSDLARAVERLAGVRVLVVGDIMLDRFVYGAVERISPEAPIPVLRIAEETALLGGAGNVLRNLAALGAQPHGIAVVGMDAAGDQDRKSTRLNSSH